MVITELLLRNIYIVPTRAGIVYYNIVVLYYSVSPLFVRI